MFVFPLLALALGFILVWMPANTFTADEAFARYSAVAVLAGLDTLLGGVRAWLQEKFDDVIFISGFFTNALLAVGLVLLGERLGLETGLGDGRISVMMIGAVVLFSGRILNNLAALRRILIERFRARGTESTSSPLETA
ncbi:MAG: small basic family protein [Armatimonadetes bacterium]|nr:small basic family protein [Armatimonadota bacterium]